MKTVINCEYPGCIDVILYYSNATFMYLGNKHTAHWDKSGFWVKEYQIGD